MAEKEAEEKNGQTRGEAQESHRSSLGLRRDENQESGGSIFNEQILSITAQSVADLLEGWKDGLDSRAKIDKLAEQVTKLAYLNMSFGFTKTSKMMAYVIIENEKKISKLQEMCIKLEKLAEYYKNKNEELLEETRHKMEELESAFRQQETDLLRLKQPSEAYEFTMDRIFKRCDLLERSIEALSDRPSNIHISHLLPSGYKASDFRRGHSLHASPKRNSIEERPYLLPGRSINSSRPFVRDHYGKKKQVPSLASPVYGPDWLGDYLQSKQSPLQSRQAPTGYSYSVLAPPDSRTASARHQADRQLSAQANKSRNSDTKYPSYM